MLYFGNLKSGKKLNFRRPVIASYQQPKNDPQF